MASLSDIRGTMAMLLYNCLLLGTARSWQEFCLNGPSEFREENNSMQFIIS